MSDGMQLELLTQGLQSLCLWGRVAVEAGVGVSWRKQEARMCRLQQTATRIAGAGHTDGLGMEPRAADVGMRSVGGSLLFFFVFFFVLLLRFLVVVFADKSDGTGACSKKGRIRTDKGRVAVRCRNGTGTEKRAKGGKEEGGRRKEERGGRKGDKRRGRSRGGEEGVRYIMSPVSSAPCLVGPWQRQAAPNRLQPFLKQRLPCTANQP